jgi:alanine racemase
MSLRATASVNLAAIERNVARLRSMLVEGSRLCAVVKADGYGHGAVRCGEAALAGGASSLAVATAAEALELRDAGVEAPVLIMGAISAEELPGALAADADVVAWSEAFVERLSGAATGEVRVHVKLDTGMGRLGTRDPAEASAVAERVIAHAPRLRLAGAMTHFATSDSDPEFVRLQLQRFEPFVAALRRRAPALVVHAANSGAIISAPASHYDLVRAGVAIYGGDPMSEDPFRHGLEPALSLHSYVAAVKLAHAGDSAGYGRRFVAERDTWIATLPIGYGDGVRRALSNNGDVLIGGRRYPLVGTVSMDNITVALGDAPSVEVGEGATLIGADGAERVTAEDLARRIGTINYEITCGISARVPRVYHRDGEPV